MGRDAVVAEQEGEPMPESNGPDVEFAVVDVETTGFAPGRDRVVEVAVVRVRRDGHKVGEYSTLINPERDVGPTFVHGVTATAVMAAPRFDEIIGDLSALMQGAIIVGHNVRFDLSFLRAEASRASYEWPVTPSLCTLALSRRLSLELPRRKLRVCCEHAGIDVVDAHSALGDATATAKLLSHYLELARLLGMTELAELGCDDPAPLAAVWPGRAPSKRAVPRAQPYVLPDDTFIQRLLHRLETAPDIEAGIEAYFDVLDRVLEDRRITDDEAEALYDVARIWNLSSEDVRRAHHRYFRALADAALGDGQISAAEEVDLTKVARLLGLEPKAVDDVRTQARTSCAAATQLAAPSDRSQPHEFRGMTVCFTGALSGTIAGDRITRTMAESLANQSGLVILDRVCRDLNLLVVADPYTQSTKAKKARDYGTRVLAEMELWRVLGVSLS